MDCQSMHRFMLARLVVVFRCFCLFSLLLVFSPPLFWEEGRQLQAHPNHAVQPAQVEAVGPIGITVSDLSKAVPFYTKILKFKKVWTSEVYGKPWEQLHGIFGVRIRTVRLRLGKEFIDLNEYLTPSGRPIPVPSHSNDLWFQHIAIVVKDMERAYKHLRHNRVRYHSTGPQRIPDWNKNAAGIKAFYFRDPDGHFLELIYFPPGKGDPRWQTSEDELFLGIDHTAIGVSKTARSLSFYHGLLGLKIGGSGVNYGIEQARLNNVENARVRITTLKAPKGPGIEFLGYEKPGPGRSYPRDSQANDLWHWQTIIQVKNIDVFWRRLSSAPRAWMVSKQVVHLNKTKRGYRKGFLARGPDGHGLLFVEY